MIDITCIKSVSDHCIRLLSATEYLRRDPNMRDAFAFANDIISSLRKLFIATLLQDKRLVCVSGLQGAGKTTLMKNFYGIEGDFWNICIGRGERIPVIITESDVTEYRFKAVMIRKDAEGNYARIEKEMSDTEFAEASKGGDPNVMYLEMTLPYKHINSDTVSFMLLPGFEEENDYWNGLIEFSVNSSDAAVFVFNETSFASHENEKYLNMVEKKFGKNLVYAISYSDSSPDENAETKQTCIKVMKVPENETDRVVCTGQFGDPEKNREWIEALKLSLDKYALAAPAYVDKNNEYIYKEILKIKDSLYLILDLLNSSNAEIKSALHDTVLLDAFDDAAKKKKKELSRNLGNEFEIAKAESRNNLETAFKTNKRLKHPLKRAVFGTNVKDLSEMRLAVENSLSADGKRLSNPDGSPVLGAKTLPDKHMAEAFRKSLTSLDTPRYTTNMRLLIDTEEQKGKTLLLPNGECSVAAANDIHALLVVHEKGDVRQVLQSSDQKKVMKAIVEVATYYFELNSHDAIAKRAGLVPYDSEKLPSLANISNVGDKLLQGAENSKKFIAGMAGIMGIDVISDGSLNFIAQIANSVGLSVPVVGLIAAAVIGFGAATAIIRDLNKIQREDFISACLAANSIYDNIRSEVLSQYDNYIGLIKDRIADNLYDLSGNGKMIIMEYNAKAEVNNALDSLNVITEEYAPKVIPGI